VRKRGEGKKRKQQAAPTAGASFTERVRCSGMATRDGAPRATMVIGGKTFNLAGLISESVLDLQMANVFKVLKKLNSLIETQAGQIQALQTKVGDNRCFMLSGCSCTTKYF